jgi:V/A-type H+-transporting ATPase subunit A
VAALVGASSLPARERVALLGGRLLRETVLQQSAVLANEAYCSATKTAALVEAVLAVVDRCQQTVERDAVLVSQVEELDFSPLLRAGPMTAPDDVPGVQARRDEVLRSLQELR